MKYALSIALVLAAAGNLATNFTLDGSAQILAGVATGLVVIASAAGLLLIRRRKRA